MITRRRWCDPTGQQLRRQGRRACVGADKNAAGAHGKPVELHLGRLWSSNITLTTRLVAYHNADAAQLVEARRLDAKKLVSHRFTLAGIMRVNHIFGNAAEEHALKVLLTNASAG